MNQLDFLWAGENIFCKNKAKINYYYLHREFLNTIIIKSFYYIVCSINYSSS